MKEDSGVERKRGSGVRQDPLRSLAPNKSQKKRRQDLDVSSYILASLGSSVIPSVLVAY